MRKTLLLTLTLTLLLLFSISATTIHYVDLPRTLLESSDQIYAFENTNRYFQVWYGDDPSTGNVVKFSVDGVEMTLLPMALNWNNDFSQIQQISMPQSVSGSPSGSNMVYTNAYGSGIDLIYETRQNQVKERLVISDRSDLTDPAQYVIDGGNAVLELGFQLESNGKIFLDGVEWDKSSEVSTTNDVIVKNNADEIVYTLPRPYAIDNNNNIVFGHFVFKMSATKLYVRTYISYDWLNDTARVYPITIDPTFTVDYSPIPASHLVDGLFDTDPDYDYTSIFDITSEMSDFSDATFEETFRNEMPFNEYLGTVVKFEETSGNTSKDYGFFGADVLLYNSPNLNVVGASGSGIDFDGVNDYGIIPRYVNLSATDDSIVCLSLLSSGVSSTEVFFDTKGGGNDRGIEFTMTPSDFIAYFVRRGAVQTTLTGTISVGDSTWHKACVVSLSNGTVELWLDGVKDVGATGITGIMDTTTQIYVGATDTIGSHYSQTLDEICSWRGVGLDEQAIIQEYNDSYCGFPEGDHIAGSWNVTYDGNYSWYLGLNKITDGTTKFYVTAYLDLENISDQTVETNLSGIGTHYILVDSLMNYMTNNLSLIYTKLRLTSIDNHNISEIFLRQEGNDTINPSINDCYVNTTTLDCGETARVECNITDDFSIKFVDFQRRRIPPDLISLNFSGTQRDIDFWYYDLSPIGFDVSVIYDFEYVFAHDYANNTNITDPNIQINYTCVTPCSEDWTLDAFTCLINDTYLATYTDQNACGTTDDLPAQNGTYQYCNYCSEDLDQILGTCQENETQTVTWHDNNYFSCCVVTGLPSDCNILTYPYNETTTQSCLFFDSDLGVPICSDEFTFKEKEREYCLVEISQNFTNESFKCMAYVENTDNEIIQVTPEYKEPKSTLFGIFTPASETREYYTPANGFVNVYITKKNLLPEQTYYLHISCKSDQRTLTSTHGFTMGYEDFQFVFFRTRWLMANASYIIGGLLLLFILIAVLWWFYSKVT